MIKLSQDEKIKIDGEKFTVNGGVFFHTYTEYFVTRNSDQKSFWLELTARWILWEEMDPSIDIKLLIAKAREMADCLNFQSNGLTIKEQTIALVERIFGETEDTEIGDIVYSLEGPIEGTNRDFSIEIYDLGLDDEEICYSEGVEVSVEFIKV